MPETSPSVRVLFCCTGVGIYNRGFESFCREGFDALQDVEGLDVWLIKGAGEQAGREIPVWCLPRTGRAAKWLGWLLNRNPYIAEQLSAFLPITRQIRTLRPHIILYSDANIGFQMFLRRKWIGVPYRLLFSNGGPGYPPFDRTDFVHQVAPLYQTQAPEFGEPASKHFMVPYGIRMTAPPVADPQAKCALRSRLGMPLDRPVVISVGAINRHHKRMHYVVEELARLPKPRPFLQLLGAMDKDSPEVIELAERLLGRDGYSANSVPHDEVFDYYRAADVFVLASLLEGFGRVYLEAMISGLPVIAHRHPVMEFVLGKEGIYGDLSRPGELCALLKGELKNGADAVAASRRWESVRNRFSWPQLAPRYSSMFQTISQIAAL